MEKKIINSNSQTNYFSEPKLLFSDLAFISGNMESLGSDGLFFDLTHEPLPLKAQRSTKAITLAFGEPNSPAWLKVLTITCFVQPVLTCFVYIKEKNIHFAAHKATMVLPSF